MNRYLPHSSLISCFSSEFLMGGGRDLNDYNLLNCSNIYPDIGELYLAGEMRSRRRFFVFGIS